jgi:transcriptional regulator with XRE-family HTH domain
MKVGINLRQFRISHGLTLRQVGELAGCSASYLSQIEAGKTSPHLNTLERICSALGMDLIDFLRTGKALSEAIPLGQSAGPVVWEWEGAVLKHILPTHISSPINYLLLEIEPGAGTALRGSRRSQKEQG